MKWVKATALPLGENGGDGAAISFEMEDGNRIQLNFWNKEDHGLLLPDLLRQHAEFVEEENIKFIQQQGEEEMKQIKQAESPIKTLVCEICAEIIAVFDVRELSMPVMGGMFKSKDPEHGLGDPFPADITWEHMKCPYCRNRPFIVPEGKEEVGPERVLTTEGLVEIEVAIQAVEPPKPGDFGIGEGLSPDRDEAPLDGIIVCPKCYPEKLTPLEASNPFNGTLLCPIHGAIDIKYIGGSVTISKPDDDKTEDHAGTKGGHGDETPIQRGPVIQDDPARDIGKDEPQKPPEITTSEEHICDTCGKNFPKQQSLAAHMRAHRGEK